MEDTLGDNKHYNFHVSVCDVLILVLMEDTLGELLMKEVSSL